MLRQFVAVAIKEDDNEVEMSGKGTHLTGYKRIYNTWKLDMFCFRDIGE